MRILAVFHILVVVGCSSAALSSGCGGILTERTGIISTPNFPSQFQTPINCQWLISKSDNEGNASIVVYLTQVFITSGLKFTEYIYYDDAYKAGAKVIHTVSESSATHVKWLQVAGPYLLIELSLDRLEGHHLRALPMLLDVFGFNITYEISSAGHPVKPYQCNTIECRFLGNCYANHNYTEYACSCFPGYSGKDCGEGPLCSRHSRPTCHNGGTCRQMGAAAVSCDCPPGVTGDLCELPVLEPAGCEDGSCILECPYDGNPVNACNCNSNNSIVVTPERFRFEAILKLADRPKITPDLYQQMTTHLKNLNISKDVEVINISNDGLVSIQCWGSETKGPAIQAAFTRLTRLGSLRLQPGPPHFHSDPALFLQTIAVDQRPIIWEDAEFTLSCVAQGSPHMIFNWYKDGVLVNLTQATRNTWTKLVDLESAGVAKWSALLSVARAAKADAGLFRCQTTLGKRQQCRAIRLHVLAPEVRLAPMSVTAQKGDNVSLTCLSTNSGGLHGKLGYSWTRNKALFPLTPTSEVWEDLVPAGSILHLYNIQKSAEYSCHVSSAVSARVRSVYVRAVASGANGSGGLCPAGQAWGLRWPTAAPADHQLECPSGYSGYATRICEMRNAPFESEWNVPDFSNCIADGLTDIYNEFEKITFGYGNTTAIGIIKKYLGWIEKKTWLYPGEGGHILRLARKALNYLRYMKNSPEMNVAIGPFFKIINLILKSEHGVLDQQGLVELHQAVMLGGALGGGTSLRLSEITVYCDTYFKPYTSHRAEFPFRNISHERWDKESVILYVSPFDNSMNLPDKIIIIFINYKNLTKYYASLYYSAEVKEGSELEFWVASHITVVRTATEDGSPLTIQAGKLTFTLLLYHSAPIPRSNTDGSIICGRYESGSWSRACKTQRLSNDLTQCTCEDQGMYALLLARQKTQGKESDGVHSEDLVAGAVGGGALSVLLSGLLLLPAWFQRRSCLMYLKLHYCFTTSLALGLMLYCLTSEMCGNMTGGWLELLLLGGGAALVAQLLLLHAELAWPIPPPSHLPRTILMLMTGVCVLAALCSRAAGGDDWGLRFHSTPLTVFAAASALLAALHFLLCICVAARLRLLASKLPDRHNYIQKRLGLMRRSAAIFICSKAFEVSCIVHYNLPGPMSSNVLAGTAIFLGTMVFCCYIIKDETPGGLRSLLRPKETDWECSSDYVNTSLSFFIKQGCDAESRSAPVGDNVMPLSQPPPHWRAPIHSHHVSDHRERSIGKQADIVKSVEFKNISSRSGSPERAMNSSSGPVSSVCDLVPSCASALQNIDQSSSHPQEYVTRVCVELGILSRGVQPPPGPPEPPILLCSVDFEPYSDHKYDLSGMDTAENCTLCIGKQKPELPEISAVQPKKSCLKNKDSHSIYCKEVPKEPAITDSEDESIANSEQETSDEKPDVKTSDSQTSTPDQPNIDGMLDLISHDLDYLLNRTAPTSPAVIPPNMKHVRQPSGDTKLFTVLDKIQEETL